MTDETRNAIHAAMEFTKGDVSKAAEYLGVHYNKLRQLLNGNMELRERWTDRCLTPLEANKTRENNSNLDIHRPVFNSAKKKFKFHDTDTNEDVDLADLPLVSPIDHDQNRAIEAIDRARAMDKEDAAVRNGMHGMGLPSSTINMALALQKFQKSHFQSALEMLGGGITKQFLDVMIEVDRISAVLNDPTCPLQPNREMILREDRARMLDVMNRFYDRANQAVLTQAKVKAMKDAAAGGGRKAGKPGFTPLIAIQGTNVSVTQAEVAL